MIFQFVFIFLIGWQTISCEDVENFSIESVLDQVAIPTKIIDAFLQKPTKTAPAKKFSSNGQPIESSTVHYENSNGFVPLIASTQPYEYRQKRRNITRLVSEPLNEERKEISHTDERSSRFLKETVNTLNRDQNRRSFHDDDHRDEFELLKVNNGTPAVANYRTFYDRSKDAIKSDHTRTGTSFKKSIKNKDGERTKRIQSYTQSYQVINNDNRQYSPVDVNEEQAKTINDHDKTPKTYKHESPDNYRTEKPKTSKSNFVTIVTPKSTVDIHISNKEKNEQHRFKSPIVIEPNAYKVDVKLNEPQVQSSVSTSTAKSVVKSESSHIDSKSEKREKEHENIGRTYDYADSQDSSDENGDYNDEVEEPRRMQKTSRRRPYHFDSSKTLPKEHRETYDEYDDQGRKRPSVKSKSRYRNKPKPAPIVHDYDQYDNEDDISDSNSSRNRQKPNTNNAWSQVGPNLEISHSNGFEVNQVEKPKLHIVPVNIVSNFDHATALDNSQGFDISNAMFSGFVHEGVFSTAAPLVSSPSNYIDQNLIQSSTSKPYLGLSTSVPDVIVGQNSQHNPLRAVLMPNQLQHSFFNQYAQSTAAPTVFAVTPSPSYLASTVAPSFDQMIKEAQIQYTNSQQYDETQSNHQTKDQGSSYGQRGRNTHSYKATPSTTTRSHFERTSPTKKKYDHNNGQYLASASLSVDHVTHRTSHNRNNKRNRNNNKKNNDNHNHDSYNSYSNNNNNNNNYNNNYDNNEEQNYDEQNYNQQTTKQTNANNFVQPTVVPAYLHTGIGLINNQNQQLIPNSFFFTNPQQNSQMFRITGYGNADTVGGASNNVNAINNLINPGQKAQLPILGPKNVEIMNPNMNGNTNVNAYAINSIPATIVTTPIPIFTTTGFIASKQAYSSTTQDPLNPDRPMYNPINFVPSIDLMRSQSIMNANVQPNEQYTQQHLNLVPIVPGGNFYKHSQGGQIDLANKPKLSSDLEKYAEEMFKESLRTIYNSQKWNQDIRYPGNISLTDDSELGRLRNELLRIRNNIKDSKAPKDILEAHQTENKIRTAKPGSDYKRPDSSIEQSYKHKPHAHNRHPKHKPEINDYLTPPKLNSFVSKSPFHDKPPKKRPGHGPRLNINHENPRLRPRQGSPAALKPIGSEAQASSVIDYRYPVRPHPVKSHYGPPDYRRSLVYNYPTFTTAFPESDRSRASMEIKSSEKDIFDFNNQRAHNLMGLLMKNKQLPPGMSGGRYSDRDAIGHYFDEENQRAHAQAYDDVMSSFQKKSDSSNQPRPVLTKVHEKRY